MSPNKPSGLFLEREASQERGEKVCPIDKTNDDPKHLCRLVEKVPRVGRRYGLLPVPGAVWAWTSPKPPWLLARRSSPRAATSTSSARPSVRRRTCWSSSSTSPAAPPQRPPSRRLLIASATRSEERRVGKEWRYRWTAER